MAPKITRHGGPTGVPADLLAGGGLETGLDFDPAEHNVGEVVAFIDEHPEAAAAVKAAEADGKARKTILELA